MKTGIFVFSSEISRMAGGIGNTTYYLIDSFKKSGLEPIGIVDRNEEPYEDIIVYETKESSLPKRIFKGVRFFKRYKKNCRICLCLSWRYAIIPYLCKSRYIVMAHGNDVENPFKMNLRARMEAYLRKRILNNAVCVCANSSYTAELVKKIRKKDIPIIIHPCSGESVDFEEKTTDELFLLSIGRLEERKGFQYGIDAFAEIVKKFPNYKYYIAGDGPYRNELERRINDRSLNNKCILLGRVSEEEKTRLLKTCTLLVMPSFFNGSVGSVEGFGIVYIEANAHGKPVIGTRSGGIPDAIIDGITGLIVDEKNTDQLIEAIELILSKEVSISENKCKTWAQKHYYTEIANEYIDLIDSLGKK